jgi:hypothetical protein
MGITLIAAAHAKPFPEVIPLPNGFRPEGIASGNGTTIFVGSRAAGAIYEGDVRTGKGVVLVPAQIGRTAVGVKFDGRTNLLYVAGGQNGAAYLYNASTGANVASVELTSETTTFINDEVVTRRSVYFTDSFRPAYYRLPLMPSGNLPDPIVVQEIPLIGDYQHVSGAFNINGIAATPNGKWLIMVSSTLGTLYRVDPDSGQATVIDLSGAAVPGGDGILLIGKTLFVVQGGLSRIAVVELDPDLRSGSVVRYISSPLFDRPTTIARSGNALYAVNGRLGTPPTPDTEYQVVRAAGITVCEKNEHGKKKCKKGKDGDDDDRDDRDDDDNGDRDD